MPGLCKHVKELTGVDPQALPDALLGATEPLLLRRLVAHWPAAQAGLSSGPAASSCLRGFYREATVGAWFGAPDIDGRFFYNDDFSGFNFRAERHRLDAVLDLLDACRDDNRQPAIYVGSTTVDTCLPGFRECNDLPFGDRQPLASVWIGNRTRIAAHHDLPDNLACVVAGHRRFTLFPPDQLGNLYVGPLDLTPAGQAISLVDFAKPDFARFPKFADALETAQVVELGPGDAIFIPSMWWHHVEALDSFNVLVNYWWRQSPGYMDAPIGALMYAIMSVRDLPAEQRAAWHTLFSHYVFASDDSSVAHIPEKARRSLGLMNEEIAREIRAQLLKRLNR